MRADRRWMWAHVFSTGSLFLPGCFAHSCAPASLCEAAWWTDLSLCFWHITKNQVFQSFISSYHGIIWIPYPRNNSRFETGPLKYFFPLSFEGHSGKTENIPAETLRFWCKRGKPLGCFTAGIVGACAHRNLSIGFFFFLLVKNVSFRYQMLMSHHEWNCFCKLNNIICIHSFKTTLRSGNAAQCKSRNLHFQANESACLGIQAMIKQWGLDLIEVFKIQVK